MSPSVLLVEDDRSLRELTALGLEEAGFAVTVAADGESGLDEFRRTRPELVILDVMLPGRDGIAVCRAIRAVDETPIVMLTARSDAADVIAGLEAGADDYLTKPFDLPVLVARLRAVLRRSDRTAEKEILRLAEIEIDLGEHRVSKDGEEVLLTATEFRLLTELARRPGRVLPRALLLELVWGYDYLGDSRLVDVAVQRLRAKIEPDPANPRRIETVRGFGYRAAR